MKSMMEMLCKQLNLRKMERESDGGIEEKETRVCEKRDGAAKKNE
jgi:hypothetical protein